MFSRKKILLSTLSAAFVAAFVFFYLIPAFAGKIEVRGDYYLGPLKFHLYSWLIIGAVIASFFALSRLARIAGSKDGLVEDLVFWNVLFGLLGARLYHVLSAWNIYAHDPVSILYFWQGGLGIYGGVVAGFLATYIYCRLKKIEFWRIADLLAAGLILGQAIGRWGNFFNQEAFGLPTSLPWKMFVSPLHRLPVCSGGEYFHPVFLYESLWDVVVFAILFLLFKKKQWPAGMVLAIYAILYPLGRFFIESLRCDATLVGGYHLNMIVSLAVMILGLILFAWRGGKDLPKQA